MKFIDIVNLIPKINICKKIKYTIVQSSNKDKEII